MKNIVNSIHTTLLRGWPIFNSLIREIPKKLNFVFLSRTWTNDIDNLKIKKGKFNQKKCTMAVTPSFITYL